MRRLSGLAGVLAGAVVALGAAAQDPNLQRGFAPGKVYDLLGLDSVGTFNGNLNVRIPLGQPYSVGPTLEYQFMLAYNSKLWEFEFLNYQNHPNDPVMYKRRPVPERRSNAGFGWHLTLGTLLPPKAATFVTPKQGWTYIAPDGSEHEFGKQDPTNDDPVVSVTTDSSYLRMRRHPADTALPVVYREVDFPSGVVRRFNPEGQLIRMYDRHGNWVNIAPSADQWVVTDGFGTSVARTHTIQFATALNSAGTAYAQPNFQKRPTQAVLAAFGGGTATFTFSYTDTQVAKGTCGDYIDDLKTHYFVPLLDLVTLPDGTTFDPSYQLVETFACTSGSLRQLVLPTRGKIAWQHTSYELPNQACIEPDPELGGGGGWRMTYAGIGERSLYDDDGTLLEKRTYTPELIRRPPMTQTCGSRTFRNLEAPPEEFRNTVSQIDPATSVMVGKTTTYFNVFPSDAVSLPSVAAPLTEYGFPVVRRSSNGGRHLSSHAYQCDSAGCGDTIASATYLKYADVSLLGADPPLPLDPRVEAQRVVYDMDTGCGAASNETCYTDTASTDFDDAGHYRKTVATSNIPGTPERTSYTNYTPDKDAWLLNLHTDSWVKQKVGSAEIAVKTVASFDSLGALTSVRTLKATGADPASLQTSSHDLLTTWCRDASTVAGQRGFVTSERYTGGDAAAIPTDPCVATRADGHYFIDHTYTFTGSSVTGHKASYAGTAHFVADEDIDVNTGRSRIVRDSSEVPTAFQFDSNGRLTSVQRTGAAWTHYEYGAASAATPPSVIVRQCASGVTSCASSALTETRYYYDGVGRVTEERRKMPASAWSAIWTVYDAVGRKAKTLGPANSTSAASEAAPSTVPATTWAYDFLGRVTRETRPDGTYTSHAYTGVRKTQRSVTDSAGTNVQSTETYDGIGRLIEVAERSGPTSAASPVGLEVRTAYSYDVMSRLATVTMRGTETVQHRVFDYDGRGFLTWESHPEAGMSSYTYDARGHVLLTLRGAARSHYDLQYFYDEAERLVSVEGRNPHHVPNDDAQPPFRTIKEFVYATDNVPAVGVNATIDRRKGKLLTAYRYNYPPVQFSASAHLENIIVVGETYRYKDAAGRRTERSTSIWKMPTLLSPWELVRGEILTGFQYNDLDQPTLLKYPLCNSCGYPWDQDKQLAPTYDQGHLTTVPGFVNQPITYWPNGLRNELKHSNGMTDKQTIDATTMMARPLSMESGKYDSCTAPAFTVQPQSVRKAASAPSVRLQVAVSGTAPVSLQWWGGPPQNYAPIPGATGTWIDVSPTVTSEYWVVASNVCRPANSGGVMSNQVIVSVDPDCAPVAVEVKDPVGLADKMWRLEATSLGSEPIVTWYDATGAAVGNSDRMTVGPITRTTTYTVRVTHTCGSDEAYRTVTIEVPLPMTTTGLTAAVVPGTNQIEVKWPASAGAASYRVERRSGATWELLASNVTSLTHTDTVPSQRTYAYRVQAFDADGASRSGYSNADIATIISFTPIAAHQTVAVGAFNEMLMAVNSARQAVGWPTVTWENIIAPSQPLPTPGNSILALHVTSCRARMNEALQALGVPLSSYTDPDLVGQPFKAEHLQQVQRRIH